MSAPAGGRFHGGCAPHSLFGLAQKENAPRPVEEKTALSALRCSGPPRATGSTYQCLLRFGLVFGHAILFCEVDTAVPWRMVRRSTGCKNAFDQLLFYCLALRRSQYFRHQCSTGSSFRAFCFATRFLGGRRGRCLHRPVAEAPSTTGQRQRKEAQDVSLTSPGQKSSQGQRVSVSDCRKGQPTFPRRRQEGCASADRPAEAFFLFGPCTARFSFGKTKREMGGALPSHQHG